MGRIDGQSIGWHEDDVEVAFENAPLENMNGDEGIDPSSVLIADFIWAH
jgi:hypothetical protein